MKCIYTNELLLLLSFVKRAASQTIKELQPQQQQRHQKRNIIAYDMIDRLPSTTAYICLCVCVIVAYAPPFKHRRVGTSGAREWALSPHSSIYIDKRQLAVCVISRITIVKLICACCKYVPAANRHSHSPGSCLSEQEKRNEILCYTDTNRQSGERKREGKREIE